MSKDKQAQPKQLASAIQSTSMKGHTPESWATKVWNAATKSKSK